MSADTFSPSCGAIEQGTGNNNNAWGVNLNGALTALDLGVAGYTTNAVTGGNLAMDGVVPPAGQHPLVQMLVNLTGVLASNQTVTVPNVSKLWLVTNGTTGAFTLQFKTTTGAASAAIPQGGTVLVLCDGANNIFLGGMSTSMQYAQWLGADGTLALPGLSFALEPATGLRRVSAGVIALTVGGVDIVTISGSTVTIASTASFSVIPPGVEMNSAAIVAPTGWYFEYGQTIARATDLPLFNAITQQFTANTNNTVTLLGISQDLRGLGLEGAVLEGTGMATGAAIVSVDSATQITMSIAATNTATGGAVRACPFGNGDGSTTFGLPDARGEVAAGRDNMGGTTRGKLTNAGSGIIGTKLNAEGGAQNLTLSLGQIPSGITSANLAAIALSVTSTDANNVCGPATADGVNGSLPNAFLFTNTTRAITSTGTIAIGAAAVTSNNTGGATTPVAQPTRIRNVLIKR
jgi:microcystin-dependent protein